MKIWPRSVYSISITYILFSELFKIIKWLKSKNWKFQCVTFEAKTFFRISYSISKFTQSVSHREFHYRFRAQCKINNLSLYYLFKSIIYQTFLKSTVKLNISKSKLQSSNDQLRNYIANYLPEISTSHFHPSESSYPVKAVANGMFC